MTSSSLSMMPVKGGSGNAFVGESDNKRVFIKKNCSPFLKVLRHKSYGRSVQQKVTC